MSSSTHLEVHISAYQTTLVSRFPVPNRHVTGQGHFRTPLPPMHKKPKP